MIRRLFSRAGLALALTSTVAPAIADVACPVTQSVYTDKETGFRLSFRPLQSWEQSGMVLAIFDIETRDGHELWGEIRTNMGTSRDTGVIYDGCPPPGPEDAPSEDQLEACRVWEGLVYSVEGNQIGAFPIEGDKAPPSLLFTDLGRQLRYAIFSSPGDEPWDQLWLTSCPPG
ncbi:hypothetical protein M3484_09600 [Pseudomonas sp. GX19020]|uniref:hypothetical protein n=1 Tax=Pseudomonas sp. GX19020 TaxID=2942277 RepID=UPI0020192119|nr:hypothetical protein [Pseudomonas sp. GX19020]MCL4066826.1 hypothetical protein [Pseudomonas sp. GX19020]